MYKGAGRLFKKERREIMIKLLIALFITMILLVGCNGGSGDSSSTNDAVSTNAVDTNTVVVSTNN